MVGVMLLVWFVLDINNKYIINYGKLASTVTFPVTYSNAVIAITDGMVRSGDSGTHFQFGSVTIKGFTHRFDSNQSGYYIAIGY